ncbi:MAG: hypothetical protein PHG91_09535 [Syntrophales bacterium]|nr:hypothetical protein [Syntrophales bacterium]MDD5533989.1 hypothetical protein [Syntrophales bacterium]
MTRTGTDRWDEIYRLLFSACGEIALSVGIPLFYTERPEAERSARRLEEDPAARKCMQSAAEFGNFMGHGLSHIRKVAADAGAIILIEAHRNSTVENTERLVHLAHLAGILHDIKRNEKDHARRGAECAAGILNGFDLSPGERDMIRAAIRNHEAFKTPDPLDDPRAQLLSDALYDADKFRWGPDNFTETLWTIIEERRIDFRVLFDRFPQGLEGIGRIRDTFRTGCGKTYGPDFIDRGLEIGRRLMERYNDISRTEGGGK